MSRWAGRRDEKLYALRLKMNWFQFGTHESTDLVKLSKIHVEKIRCYSRERTLQSCSDRGTGGSASMASISRKSFVGCQRPACFKKYNLIYKIKQKTLLTENASACLHRRCFCGERNFGCNCEKASTQLSQEETTSTSRIWHTNTFVIKLSVLCYAFSQMQGYKM